MSINYNEIFPDEREKYIELSKLRQVQLIELRILKIFDDICKRNGIKYWLDFGNLLGAVRHKGFIPWDDDIDVTILYKDYKKLINILKKELPEDLFLQTLKSDKDFLDVELIKIRDRYSNSNNNKSYKFHNGIFIDIFPLYKLPESNFLRFIQKRLYRLLISSRKKRLKYEKLNHRRVIRIVKGNIRKLLSKFITIFIELDILEEKILNMYKLTKKHIYSFSLHKNFSEKFKKEDIFPLKELEYEKFNFFVPNNYDKYLKIEFGDYMKLPPKEEQRPHHFNPDEIDITKPCEHKESLYWEEKKQ
ncbi:LicD family protein [Haliovirga abyssi]|uniref:LPS cholinephosphotransferase n=1 Tax=Haliovirga abyssi TaxID=2996794 RepID=A0AAU9DRU5_9FUSO|nr:LicD family protein [Haliovirga abyssi]BDU49689.1 LPS cholinephosphotransferase [Haliovirga abyssi]